MNFSCPPNQFDEIEPLENDADSRADVLSALIGYIFGGISPRYCSTDKSLKSRLDVGYRRFVSLSLLVNPSAINGKTVTYWRIAECLGVTRAALSKIMVELSEALGVNGAAMKSQESRLSYSRAGGSGAGSSLPKSKPCSIGEEKPAERLRKMTKQTATIAIRKFIGGKVWSLVEVRALLTVGWITEDAKLTSDGERMVEEMRGQADEA